MSIKKPIEDDFEGSLLDDEPEFDNVDEEEDGPPLSNFGPDQPREPAGSSDGGRWSGGSGGGGGSSKSEGEAKDRDEVPEG